MGGKKLTKKLEHLEGVARQSSRRSLDSEGPALRAGVWVLF